jgi:predicted permease
MMGGFMDDVRVTFRSLFRSRGVSTILVLTLGLGIGASTAVFSVLDGVLLRPLPYDEPDELITVRHELTQIANLGLQGIPGPDLLDYMAGAPSIESLGNIFTLETNLNDGQGAARVTLAWITPDFFDVLGTDAAVGRMLDPTDWIPRTRAQMEDPAFTPPPMPVMLSNEMWSARFAADPDLIGKSITINGTQMNVIGVLPPGFRVYAPANTSIPSRIDAYSYVPLPMTEGGRAQGQGLAVARLADGATIEQARSELERVAVSLVETYERHAQLGTRVVVGPLLDGVVGEARPFLWILFGSIGLVLLIAILNVANLLLVEAGARRQEFAVRIALGVHRLRMARQLLTENFIIAGMGAAVGLGVAVLGVRALVALAPADLPRVGTIGIDGGVLLFTVTISAMAALIFGVAPAISLSRVDPATLLATRGAVGTGRSGARLRNSLIVGEVAVSVLLVAGAGLLLRSFAELSAVNPGYDPEGAVALEVALPFFTYRELERRQGFFGDLLERTRALPGVDAAGIAPGLPLTESGGSWSSAFGAPGADLEDPDAPRARYRAASSGFFEALGAHIVEGRAFEVTDGGKDAELVVLVDQRLAEAEWPEGDAVGSYIDVGIAAYIGPGRQATARIVGVVESVRYSSLMEQDEPTIWIPFNEYAPLEAALVLRGPGDPVAAAAQIRQVLRDLDPSAPVYALRTLTDDVRAATARSRYALLLMAIFAMAALLLAAVGLYGVVSHAVQQRTREIGVRIALGAKSRDIGSMVLAQGARLTFFGGILGTLAVLMVSPVLESLLYEVSSWDPITLLGTSILLVLVATVAAWFPAARASRVDPINALKTE